MTRFIRIDIEIPDEAEVRFGGSPVDDAGGEQLPPPWWAAPDDEPAAAVRTVAVGSNRMATGSCPVHRALWKVVPAGVSKRTGRPYAAFVACPEPGCDEKPPISRRTAS
jgi:hypothetical protein